MPKVKIPSEDRYARAFFGLIMTTAVLYSWGKWVTFILGILFLISASQGFCLTCYLYKRFQKSK